MASTLWIVSLVAAALTVADQLRRPASEWTAADRDRGFWVTWTVIAGFLCLGFVAAIVYAIGVAGRFGHAQQVDPGFRTASPPAPRTPAPSQPLWADRRPVPEQRPAPGRAEPTAATERPKLVIEIDDL